MSSLDGLLFLILTVGIGYGASAAKLLPEKAADALPPLLFNICYPAMILDTFLTVDKAMLLGAGLPTVIATVVITLILFALGLLLFRKAPEEKRALLVFLMGVGNVTYVAIPLFSVFLPAEAVMLAILHSAAQDPLIWGLYHPMLLNSAGGSKQTGAKILTNPCLIAAVVGAVLCLTGIRVPELLAGTAARLADATSPLALLLIGMLIRQHGLFSWVRDKGALLYGLLKVIALPCCLVILLIPVLGIDNAILLGILFGSPAPLLSVVWAKQNGREVGFAIHCLLFSTLLFLTAASAAILLLTGAGILR